MNGKIAKLEKVKIANGRRRGNKVKIRRGERILRTFEKEKGNWREKEMIRRVKESQKRVRGIKKKRGNEDIKT